MHLHRTANAIRVSRAYQRRRSGVVVLSVEVRETALADALVADLLLDPNNADNKAAITKALERMIELYVVEKDL